MNALQKIKNKLHEGKHICIGLDTDQNKLPSHLKNDPDGIIKFNSEIIKKTSPSVCAYKINLAFYERDGQHGFDLLKATIDMIPEDILIIGDAKRGDIGNTSQMYAHALYDHFKFDSVTLNPYMGRDSLQPFLEYHEKLNFILALTSNPGSHDFEKQILIDKTYLYQEVIKRCNEWNEYNNLGIVFGATNLEELRKDISLFKSLFILLPGIGAQGGNLEEVVQEFDKANNHNFIINVSRAILYADSTNRYAEKSIEVLDGYNKTIKSILKNKR